MKNVEERRAIFIEKAEKVHPGLYGYDRAKYGGSRVLVEIFCKKHKEYFWQHPNSHLMGRGCPICAREKQGAPGRISNKELHSRCIKTHNGYYSYDLAVFNDCRSKIIIKCPKHGYFTQQTDTHYRGSGCPECGNENKIIFLTNDEFITKSKVLYGDEFLYHNTKYTSYKSPVIITCRKHGDFIVGLAQSHLLVGQKCPTCTASENSKGTSNQEQDLLSFIKGLGLEVLERNKKIIYPLELDIVIPELKISIEYNGLFWHSEKNGRDDKYHLQKLERANSAGYRLIQLFSDQWEFNKEETKNYLISHLVGQKEIHYKQNIIHSDRLLDESTLLQSRGFQKIGTIPPTYFYTDKCKRFSAEEIESKYKEIPKKFLKVWDCGKDIWQRVS